MECKSKQVIINTNNHINKNKLAQKIMSNSPYVPNDIKEYLRKSQIEEFVNRTINDLLKQRPQDPYSYLIGQFQKKAKSQIQIQNLLLQQTISGEGFPVIKVKAVVKFMNKEKSFFIQQPFGILSEENNLFDVDGVGQKGQKKAISYYTQKIQNKIQKKGIKCSQQDLIDNQLLKTYKQSQQKSVYVVNTISFSIPCIKSIVLSQSLYKTYAQLAQNEQVLKEKKYLPKLIVNCLQGGKAIGSKCKVFKYYIIGQNVKNPFLAQTVLQNIKKTICSGKGGEAALKYSPDGTFVCPLDTILDNLKIVQDAINSANAKQQFSIGLSWLADTFYTPETKKYQLQNPKTPFDNDQMIDYLVKLLTDKPIISYLQDPLAPTQVAFWKKLTTKIKSTEAIKTVKIGSRSGKLVDLTAQNFKQNINELSLPVTQDSHPDLSAQQRQLKNSQKLKLDMIQIRAFQNLTVTNLIRAQKQLKKVNTVMILQDNGSESYNTDLIDISYGLKCYPSVGSIVKFDRISKLNRIKQILEQL